MSVILQAADGADVQINQWNWRPTVALIGKALPLNEERREKLTVNGIGAAVSEDEARAIANYLDVFLSNLSPDSRVLLDGSVTKDSKVFKQLAHSDADSYSASYTWLVEFREFCAQCKGGFTVV